MNLYNLYSENNALERRRAHLQAEAVAAFKAEIQEIANTGFEIRFFHNSDGPCSWYDFSVKPKNKDVKSWVERKLDALWSIIYFNEEITFKKK